MPFSKLKLESTTKPQGSTPRNRYSRRQRESERISNNRKPTAIQRLVYGLEIVLIVGLFSFSLDWLQPLEAAVLGFLLVSIPTLAHIVLWRTKFIQRRRVSQFWLPMSMGLPVGWLVVALAGWAMNSLERIPESKQYTDRELIEFQHKLSIAIQTERTGDAVQMLNGRLEAETSGFWMQRWKEMLFSLENLQSNSVPSKPSSAASAPGGAASATSLESVPPSEASLEGTKQSGPAAESASQINVENPLPPVVENKIGNSSPGLQPPSSEIVNLQPRTELVREAGVPVVVYAPVAPPKVSRSEFDRRIKQFNLEGDYAGVATYLQRLVEDGDAQEWIAPFDQALVQNEIQWGKTVEDLDQRYVHFLRALEYGKSFNRDVTEVQKLLDDVDWQRKQLPLVFPSGLEQVEIARLTASDSILLRFSIVNGAGMYFTGLATKDFQASLNGRRLSDFRFTQLHQRDLRRPNSVLILVDQSSSMSSMRAKVLTAVKSLIKSVDDDAVFRVLTYADKVNSSNAWNAIADSNLDIICSKSSIHYPNLTQAAEFAIGELERRNTDKTLILITAGGNSYVRQSNESLVKRAETAQVRVYTFVLNSEKITVSPLLSELTAANGGLTERPSVTAFNDASLHYVGDHLKRSMYEIEFNNMRDQTGSIIVKVGRGNTAFTVSTRFTAEHWQ